MKIEKTTQDVEVKTVVKQKVINIALTEGEYYFLEWLVSGYRLADVYRDRKTDGGDGERYHNLVAALKTQKCTTENGYRASEMFKVQK